ncbi:unnamed protein product [Brassicogethes aeneus]|uniref:BRCT domain-containing protein n=1 Tax=Brassicogethes aeneus TaxID=1431903 RepID=A0A9P0B9V1_BRAAE|nr:unnamed protein product [Brassicogethes aeneus]
MDNIRIIFILPSKYKDENEATDIMLQAYEVCKQNVRNVSWVKEDEYDSADLGKTDFVIFEDFSGVNYEKLIETKCARILGPWCVYLCLMEGKPIPNFTWPIYNIAMFECVVVGSYLPKKTKKDIKNKVELMGGRYIDTLLGVTTHVITESVQTEKYARAAELGLKILLPGWVDAVWEASQSGNVHANDEQFQSFKVPPLHNLVVCSTGFTRASERSELTRIVSENGGNFTGKLSISSTDVLVCKGTEGSTSEKYKAAVASQNIKCVTLDWITESVKKGYALPHKLFPVKKGQSTPIKNDESVNPNFSTISAIVSSGKENRTTIDESVAVALNFEDSVGGNASTNKRKGSLNDEHIQLIDNLDVRKAKRAGQYLDGCSVYVAGFDSEHREKLCKILNLSGATRYDSITDRVTHVIVGDVTCHDVKIIKSKGYACALVSLRWLVASMEKREPAPEEDFLVGFDNADKSDMCSPLSRKGLKLLKSDRTMTENEAAKETVLLPAQPDEPDIMQQYLKPMNTADEDTLAQLLKNDSKFTSTKENEAPRLSTMPPPPEPEISAQQTTLGSNLTDDDTVQPCDVFEGLKFALAGFKADEVEILSEQIKSCGGEIVAKSFKGVLDYAVLPVFNDAEIRQSAAEVVTDLWVAECIEENEVREVLYYHQPFVLQNSSPLENCVITCSGVCSYERNFLRNLIVALGGKCQDQFARYTSVEKGVLGSTHLVSLDASGKKYSAAIKWGLPAVSKDWLLEVARTGLAVLETPFLLGESKAPERPAPTPLGTPNYGTPKSTPLGKPESAQVATPVHQKFNNDVADMTPAKRNFDLSSGGCSQVTPVSKIMQEVRSNNLLGTPDNSPVVYDKFFNIKTPDTPLERFLTPTVNKELRKRLLKCIYQFPEYVPPPPTPRRTSTPLSELKKRLRDKICKGVDYKEPDVEPTNMDMDTFDDDVMEIADEVFEQPQENPEIQNKLEKLEELMNSSSGTSSRRPSRLFQSTVPEEVANMEIKDSQAFTVGWDYRETAKTEETRVKIFMISGIDNDQRQSYAEKLESLGAIVSELASYDPNCTHLICPKPARNEKTLSCMAAGKWILHESYVQKSIEAGKFLNEELFEFGNPKSSGNFSVNLDREGEARANSMHYWRKEISGRGYGAFSDMRAMVVAAKREPIVRVVEAGGGVIVDMSPPFDDTVTINATHCLLEPRKISMEKMQDYIILAKQGIYCVNTLYISDFLQRITNDVRDCILPPFTKYYSRSDT